MGIREILQEAKKKESKKNKNNNNKSKNGKNGKMLKGLHDLDDKIEDFIDKLEGEIIKVEDNPMFVKKAHQLLADMSKEYAEFIVALRAIVNAVDRKGKILPAFEKQESRVRDVLDGAGNGPPPKEEEPEELPPEEEEDNGEDEFVIAKKDKKNKKKNSMKEALELDESSIKFDSKKMKKLVMLDNFLSFQFNSMLRKMPEKKALEAMFNTFVVGDSVMERKYNNQ